MQSVPCGCMHFKILRLILSKQRPLTERMFRKRSFDNIAASYAVLERLTFGRRLQDARTFALRQIHRPIKRALLLGDGNGSFAIELLKRHPNCQIVSVEISPKMLAISQQRIKAAMNGARYAYDPILADARDYDFPATNYDFVGLHFFLDCFNDANCERIIQAATKALEPGGVLSFADFGRPAKQPYRGLAHVCVRSLYFGFRLLSGLQTTRLPQCHWPPALKQTHEKQSLKGLLSNKAFVKV
jgi:tRNA (cmo5U34)-methyltransferase